MPGFNKLKMAKKKDLLKCSPQELIEMISKQEKVNAELNARVVDLEKIAEDKDSIINDLISKNGVLAIAKEKPSAVIVDHKGKKYQVVIPKFSLDRNNYTAADLQENEKLMDRLLELKSGVINEIE